MIPVAAIVHGAWKGLAAGAVVATITPESLEHAWFAWLPVTVTVFSVLSQVFPADTWYGRLIHILALAPRPPPDKGDKS